eukprot:14019651-Heterocapsa_arctica.AAC.1
MDGMNNLKKGEKEEERAKTEESEEEEEEQLPGARGHDMYKWQENDVRKWLDENPALKADAMMDFDKKLMDGIEGTYRAISQTQEILSGRTHWEPDREREEMEGARPEPLQLPQMGPLGNPEELLQRGQSVEPKPDRRRILGRHHGDLEPQAGLPLFHDQDHRQRQELIKTTPRGGLPDRKR